MDQTHRYRISDLVLETNIPLPEAVATSEQNAECRFQWMGAREAAPKPSAPYHRWMDQSGKPYAWFSRRRDGYHIRFRRMADFVISEQADEIRCYPHQKTSLETVRHLLLDSILPVTLSRRGRLSLHASAVETPAGAIGFLGGGGLGKSTLAAGLGKRGFAALCDDTIVLKQDGESIVVVPAGPGVQLAADSAQALLGVAPQGKADKDVTRKKWFHVNGNPAKGPMNLLRLYVLAKAERTESGVVIERLSFDDTVAELMKFAHLLDIADQEVLQAKLDELIDIAKSIPCFLLSFPREYSRLDDVCDAIIAG